MENVMVYVILLDNLAGFNNALNETLMNPQISHNITPVLQQCDTDTTEQILSATNNKDQALELADTFKTNKKLFEPYLGNTQNLNSFQDYLQDQSKEGFLNNELSDESALKTYRKEKARKYFDSFELDSNFVELRRKAEPATEINELLQFDKEEIIQNVSQVTNVTKTVELPKIAPFLVAIFETVLNTTAQTCAGTLIAPHWVLTASNCLNVLSTLYTNNTNMTGQPSLYTVVADATNPLSDGSVHNVTTVYLHHGVWDNTTKPHKSVHVEIGPYLAMLHIEPEIKGAGLQLVEEKVKKGGVMIYGWVFTREESGESLRFEMMSAQILSTAECQVMYNYNNKDVICLYNNEKDRNLTQVQQLSSGGPVLMLQDNQVKMLAVVQADEQVFIAYPVYTHIDWINKILENKV